MKALRLIAIGIAISAIWHFLDTLIDLAFRGYTRVVFIEPVAEVRIVEIFLMSFSFAYFTYELYRVVKE